MRIAGTTKAMRERGPAPPNSQSFVHAMHRQSMNIA